MSRFDLKHAAFHTLVGLYAIWIIIFTILLVIAGTNAAGANDPRLSSALSVWISMNLFTGGALYIVIRLFRDKPALTRIIRISFIAAGFTAIGILVWLMSAK